MKSAKKTNGEFYDDVSYVNDKDFAGMKYKKKKKHNEEKKEIVMFDEKDFLTENTTYDEISPEGGDEDDLSIEEYEEIRHDDKKEYIPQHITEEDYETYKKEIQEYNNNDESDEEREEEIFKEEFDALKQTEEDEIFKDVEIDKNEQEEDNENDEDDVDIEEHDEYDDSEDEEEIDEDISINNIYSEEIDIFNDNFDAFEDVKDEFFGADFKTFGEEDPKEEIEKVDKENQVEDISEEEQEQQEAEDDNELEVYQLPDEESAEVDDNDDEEEEIEQDNLDNRELSTEFVDKKNKKENKRTIIAKEINFSEWNDDYSDERESEYESVNKHQKIELKERKKYPPKIKKEKTKEPKEIRKREPIDLSNLKNIIEIKYLIIFIIIISIISLITSMFIIYNSFGIKEKKSVDYKEISNISYKVFLNNNDDLYAEEKQYDSYLSKMIKIIKINMNYNFNIAEESDLLFNHRIVGDLIINEKDTNKQIYKNTYVLSGYEKNEITKSTTYNIDKDISIDYWYYKNIAEKFNKTYSSQTESYLLVYLTIDEKDNINNKFAFNNNATASIKIPLSENVIKLEIENIDKKGKTSGKKVTGIVNASKFLLGIMLFLFATIVLIYIKIKYFDKEISSEYEIKIKELVDKYDHLILITQFPPTESKVISEFKSFDELLNIRKKLSQKIKYFEAKKNKESIFYIEDEDKTYVYKITNN